MPDFRYVPLGPLPSPGGTPAYLGLAVRDEARAGPVVLVWVPQEIAQDPDRSERLERETERAALLDHPHIVRVYGFARLEQGLARVVEFADGESLRRILQACGPLPPALAARLIADAAQGVHYAHLAGNDDGTPLLHGDIRPETLLVAYDGHAKISGYGASAFAPKESRIRNLRVAPEQVLGGRAAMNVQTDVYLLAATLLELLTGKAPFEDEENFERAVLSQELALEEGPQLPTALVEVLRRALAKKAADRFPSALLLREALELAIQPLPSHPEIAAWLTQHFSDQQGARGERQRMIDAAIASFARRQWEQQEEVPRPAPAPAPAAAAPAALATPPPSRPAPAKGRPAPPPTEPEEELTEPPAPKRPRLAAGVVALVALGAVALVYWVSRRETPPMAYPPELTLRTEADAGVAARPADAGAGMAVLPSPRDAGPADPGSAAPVALEEAKRLAVLKVTAEPRVSVEIDGNPAGRSPVRVSLLPGRHRVRLLDRAQGIDVTRVVNVAGTGVTEEAFYLQRGFVAVTAPPGATIEIDGRVVGKAPLRSEVAVYEGNHRIEVVVGKSRWGEAFTIKPNQRVYFDVGPQYE